MTVNRLNGMPGHDSLPAGAGTTDGRDGHKSAAAGGASPGVGANGQQAGAGRLSPPPRLLVDLVDDMYEQGDTLGLQMMSTALDATYRALERKPAELKAVE